MELLGNIKSSLVNTFSTTSPPPAAISKSEVRGLEETERSRRLEQVSQARVDKQNASNVSTLIKGQSFPVFKGNVSRGYKRVTTKFEDEERRRRITNKSESALRRTNANKTARMIQTLGWPLYKQGHSGAEYILMDPTKLLEEEEREWRTTDSYWTPTARHNAATVANILRWNNFQRNPRAGFKRHVKYLEEKERNDRVQADVMNNAMQNSYNEARCIRQKGAPFYVQEAPMVKRDFSQVHKLEESERKRRMQNPGEQQLAKELAGLVGSHLNKQTDLEEKERGRRITDIGQQNVAKANAKQVSLMVRESSTTKIAGQGPMWLGISRNSMRALEEIERTRRVRDVAGQRVAREHAKAISNLMLGRMIAPAKPNFAILEEEERQSRILDRLQQQTAVKNARKVSGLIARHMLMSSGSKSYALALEESERSRRLQDNEQQRLARDNAKKVSSLVSSLQYAPGNTLSRSQTVPSLPTQQAQLSAPAPTTLPADVPRSSGEFHKTQSPLVAAAPMARSVSSHQIGSPANPIVLPTVYSTAPVAPVAPIQQLASSPTIQPIVLPTTSAPVPVAPLASTIPRQPSFNTVPVDTAATSVAQLGDKERKRLLKEVDKHNKKSETNVRKAEQQMLKAEKFHQKGRDDKALKLEGKAEKLMQDAEHERKWANGIQNELRNTPAPASM